MIPLEPCALNTEFQHLILSFNKFSLLYGYHWEMGYRGWKEAQRHGEFTEFSKYHKIDWKMCNSVSFFLLFNDMSDQTSKISTFHMVCSEVNRQYGKLRSEQIILISVKLLPSSDVKAFCLHHYDCMMVWLQVSMHQIHFFLSLKNSILDCFQWSWFTFCFFSSQLYCAKSFIVSELIQKWKGKL